MTALLHLAWQIDRFHCMCVMRFLSTAQISTPSIKNFHPIILVKFKQLLHLHSMMSAKRCVPSLHVMSITFYHVITFIYVTSVPFRVPFHLVRLMTFGIKP